MTRCGLTDLDQGTCAHCSGARLPSREELIAEAIEMWWLGGVDSQVAIETLRDLEAKEELAALLGGDPSLTVVERLMRRPRPEVEIADSLRVQRPYVKPRGRARYPLSYKETEDAYGGDDTQIDGERVEPDEE